MITILKGKDITVEWKVVSLETKQPTVFISNETHVFLIAPNDIYTLPFEVVREDFCGLRVTIPTAYLTTGVYDLKVIWLKDVMRESLVNKQEYRNASIKREVFSLTDDVSEVTYDGEIIKIVSGAETFGRDGMSAYEIAAFRGVLPKGMSEAEWANQENVRQQNEAKRESAEDERIIAEATRQQNELKRESQESVRTETFNAKERGREQAFDDAQSRRDAEFQRSEASRSNTFTANEQSRQQSFEAHETSRQNQEAARVIAEGARATAEALRKQAEEARKDTFAANEAQREQTFEANEAERQSTFADNEASRQEAESVREANEKRREETYKSKVDRDDNAPKLTAGFANNLVGRGEATEEEISFRPSGGDTSIEDGTARIERMKGNTVVWNQLTPDVGRTNSFIKIVSTSPLTLEGVSAVGDSNVLFVKKTSVIKDHIYLIRYTYKYEGTKDKIRILLSFIEIKAFNYGTSKFVSKNTIETRQYILRAAESASSLGLTIGYNEGMEAGERMTIYEYQLIDLTQMFGAGNEPTTIEEFNARKPIGIDEYAYNEGELISTNVDEVKSVGFNAYNGEYAKVLGGNQYELVGTYSSIGFSEEIGGELTNIDMPSDKLYTPDKDGYIYAQGTDICIHLVHTGYRNGEYEPYKEFRRSIPISEIKDSEGNQLFPNGLLSAGSVYDEITTTKAIKRIGVVDMGSLNWTINSTKYPDIAAISFPQKAKGRNLLTEKYTTLGKDFLYSESGTYSDKVIAGATEGNGIYVKDGAITTAADFKTSLQGVMLYYELAEPIEVDLPEPLNLNYEVSDFGTEEVISDVPTTPLKADIIYQFNAIDRIRDNSRHTAEAEELLNAKADKTTVEEIQKKELQLSVKDNGNIVLSNANGDSKEFMPATPSGDPMHYAYIDVGAEWNDTDATITKTLETVSYDNSHFETFAFEHKPKCWYLNGVGDITNEEMRAIYNYPHYAKYSGAYSEIKQKTVIFNGNGPTAKLHLSYWFAESAVKSLIYKNSIHPSSVAYMFFGANKLEYLLPANKNSYLYGYEGFRATDLASVSNTNWKEIRIYLLKKPCDFNRLPNISKNSVLYAINTCSPTTAITITLHTDAYARLGEDADVLAALEAKNVALQGTGGSISLVSA